MLTHDLCECDLIWKWVLQQYTYTSFCASQMLQFFNPHPKMFLLIFLEGEEGGREKERR